MVGKCPAPPPMPPSSRAKDYTERPSEVVDELDELRNRGIAKILNKHFTDTTKKLAKEKAAADAALADLERRRANTSKFVPSKGGDLNPFDSLYIELQQRRAECRRKEKETMLLYQRYVLKYGKAAKKLAPKQALAKDMQVSEVANSVKLNDDLPPSSPIPSKGTPLQPLEEDEVADGGDAGFSHLFTKVFQSSSSSGKDPPTTSSPAKEDMRMPDLEPLTPATSRDTVSSIVSDPPERAEEPTSAPLEDLKSSKLAPMKEESTKADPPSDPPADSFHSTPDDNEKCQDMNDDVQAEAVLVEEPPSEPPPPDDMSEGGPAVLCATVVGPKEEPAILIAPEQPEESPQLKNPVAQESESEISDNNRPTTEVMTEVPSTTTATADEEGSDERSVISGLTTNSTTTRQVLEEIETEMDEFLKTETEAIKKLLDHQEGDKMGPFNNSSSNFLNSSANSVFGDESVKVAMKAEAMAKEMQKILVNYQKEDSSIAGSTSAADGNLSDTASASSSHYPKKFPTEDQEEEWLVYFDHSFQREYYFERKSNRTQWDPPSTKSRTIHAQQQVESDDFVPETPRSLARRASRRDVYKKRRRKRRLRRVSAASMVVLCATGSYIHWQRNHPDKAYAEAMAETWKVAATVVSEARSSSVAYVKDRYEYVFTDRRSREQVASLNVQKQAALEAERRAREEAEKRAIETERKKELERKRLQEANRLEQERLAEKKDQEEALRRPWGCNIPLSYVVHPRCRRLSRLNPMFEETDLLGSFLQ